MVEAIIALGSNLGDRERNLATALDRIGRLARITIVSSVYETDAMYLEDQARFLNCVIAAETSLSPRELLGHLKEIEREVGRRPGPRFGPRAIDLDILLYDGEVVSEPDLVIPHPRMAERPFVLVPLDEIRSGLLHPVSRMTVHQMLVSLSSDKRVVRVRGPFDLGSQEPRRP